MKTNTAKILNWITGKESPKLTVIEYQLNEEGKIEIVQAFENPYNSEMYFATRKTESSFVISANNKEVIAAYKIWKLTNKPIISKTNQFLKQIYNGNN